MHDTTLYLASASPRRHDILKQLDIPHSVLRIPSPKGEDEPRLRGESPQDYVRRTAYEKARNAVQWMATVTASHVTQCVTHSHAAQFYSAAHASDGTSEEALEGFHPSENVDRFYILSADTTVVIDEQTLGKPADRTHAAQTLKLLSGRTHQVLTAVALYHQGQFSEALSVSTVRFKTLTDLEIETYCATGDPMGKAGAYGIQGPAAAFVSHLSGSYTGVMGLPAHETAELLRAAGLRWL